MAPTRLGAFDSAIWSSLSNERPVNLVQLLDLFIGSGEPRVALAAETIFTDGEHPLDLLRPTGVYDVQRAGAGVLQALRLTDKDGEWLLLTLGTGSPGVFHLMSAVPRTDPRWQRVERWTSRAREVSRCFLNHVDFAAIGDRLAEYGQVEVVKVAARVVSDGSSINRGFPVRDGADRPNHADEIREIEQLGASIRTLTLHVGETLDVHLRRIAGATFYGGSFRVFASEVLRRLEASAAARRNLLTGRARKEGDQAVESVTVALGTTRMEDAADTADVLDVVGAMPDFSMAVFHRNPYLHFAVTDEIDGSNFDILITRPDAIDIYPGFRSSASSLARVSQRIGEALGALAIDDGRVAEPVSIYDLR